ncbi:deoxyguanosinetriphosphate triphosphohydrolase family protein [Paenibacillus mucilaginosus]|uniref:Deoxyguanosinetriphosphate triphosphohydrolase n=1 Tax=Paenibacillus mucilaginosus (strain KNP414) TaxID=1036673 RepID=F8FNC7_PAEMK|nr:dNTP triphosphohydrolase [Paenibacillus mucilaginosus]AEI38964.1 deoxyguanosinetriphosphate triphosphohydrolase [Paenibacillus mucilaginosus KNP414]MCG7216585.1 dNTP triphosphohydrolase [Paenibacillus mucilaginosus]WDM28009.1 dNTP triphosphohydrolase [Paenibacillus mucilaginosus]
MDLRKLRLDEPSSGTFSEERDEYERDYARLIQSPAFRRLQGKSQVFGAGSGDYYRTRLTHSLEVSQIARETARRMGKLYPFLGRREHPGLILDPAVVECASLAHDLGHPPFGHKGEEVLDRLLAKEHGMKYEGNAQNFRILMFLEKRAGSDSGLDLTAAVLLAINKYPYCIEDPGRLKGCYGMEWEGISELRRKWNMPTGCSTLEAQLMDLCDDIAYSTHDIEDGIRAGKIGMNRTFFESERLIEHLVQEIVDDQGNLEVGWESVDIEGMVRRVLEDYLAQWEEIYEQCGRESSRTRREMKARWVSTFAGRVGIIDDTARGWKKVTFVRDGQQDLELLRTMEILKKLAWVTLIKDFRVQRLQKRSEIMIKRLWDSFKVPEQGRMIIPPDWIDNYKAHQGKWTWPRFIADYISGMTDAYAEKVYAELFASKSGSIYEMD